MFYKDIALCDTRLSFIVGFMLFTAPRRVITLLWSSNNIVPSLVLLQTSWYSLLATSLFIINDDVTNTARCAGC